jgi:hypothetical protein
MSIELKCKDSPRVIVLILQTSRRPNGNYSRDLNARFRSGDSRRFTLRAFFWKKPAASFLPELRYWIVKIQGGKNLSERFDFLDARRRRRLHFSSARGMPPPCRREKLRATSRTIIALM